MLDLKEVENQYNMVKDQPTFVITSETVRLMIEKIKEQNEEIEQLKEDYVYWKIKYRDLIDLEEYE